MEGNEHKPEYMKQVQECTDTKENMDLYDMFLVFTDK